MVVEDEVSDAVQQYIKRDAIPQSLLSAYVFKKQWFLSTFLPKLLSPHAPYMKGKKELIEALVSSKKIPAAMYQRYTESLKG